MRENGKTEVPIVQQMAAWKGIESDGELEAAVQRAAAGLSELKRMEKEEDEEGQGVATCTMEVCWLWEWSSSRKRGSTAGLI